MTTATLPDKERERIRRTRRYPVRTQPDYLILRFLVLHLEQVLGEIRHPVDDVLDLWCGTQPYRDLVPPHRRYVAMDIDDCYGTPDVISDEFLPFPDSSFDLILFTEAFHYLTEPREAVEELARVLRPGGTLVLTVPLVWEYDRRIVERRYTGPQLAQLFADWDDVWVLENGGYAVAWATVTGRILRGFHEALPTPAQRLLRPLFDAAAYALNVVATLLTRAEPRWHKGPFILPMGLLVRARWPGG